MLQQEKESGEMSNQTMNIDMTRMEAINNDEFHLKNLLCIEYGKGLMTFDDRHMLNLALKEVQLDLSKKLVSCNKGTSKSLVN